MSLLLQRVSESHVKNCSRNFIPLSNKVFFEGAPLLNGFKSTQKLFKRNKKGPKKYQKYPKTKQTCIEGAFQ